MATTRLQVNVPEEENTQVAETSELTAPAPEQKVEAPQEPAQSLQLEPETESPTVVSTDSMREQLKGAEETLKRMKAEMEAQPEQPTQDGETKTDVPKPKPEQPETEDVDAFITEYEQTTEEQLNNRKNEFNRYLTRSDNMLRSQVNTVQQTFDQRRQQSKEVAKNAKAATSILGARTGRQRYAPEIQRGIITGQENALIETLATIDAQEAAAISQAESAAFNRDYGVFIDKMESIDGIQKERENKLDELTEVMKEENERREQELETKRQENMVIEQIADGITDPIEIFSSLNGDVPYDLVREYTDSLPEEASTEPVKIGSFEKLVDPVTGETIAYGGKLGAGGGVSGGSTGVTTGGSTITESGSVVTDGRLEFNLNEVPKDANLLTVQVGPKIYGGRISNDESKRIEDLANKGIAAGQTTAEIMDAIMGYTPSKNKDFAVEMRNILMSVTNAEDGLSDFDMVGLARLIENDNLDGAVRKVEQTVMRQARQDDPSIQMSEGSARIFARQESDFQQLLEDMPQGLSGATEGTVDEWLGRFRNTEQTKIKQRITEITAKLRNDLLGSAVTDSEEAFLEALLPKLSDQPAAFEDKINRLAETPLIKLNEIRSQYGLPKMNQQELLNTSQRVNLYQGRASENLGRETNRNLLLGPSGGNGSQSGGSGVPSVLDGL